MNSICDSGIIIRKKTNKLSTMKNRYLKHILSSGLVAVFAGVLAFSFDTAHSSNSIVPSSNPPGTGVTPTFNGVTVKGDTKLEGNLSNPGTSNTGAVTINDSFNVTGLLSALQNLTVTGQFTTKSKSNLEGQIVNEGAFYSGSVYVNDALQVVSDFLIQGVIKNPLATTAVFSGISLSTLPVTISGDLKMTGTGNIDLGGKLINTKKKGTGEDLPVEIYDTLMLWGDIVSNNPTSPVTVNGDFETNSLLVNNVLDIANGLNVIGGGAKISGGATISGDLSSTGKTAVNYLTNYGPSYFKQQTNAQAGLDVKGGATVDTLSVSSNATVTGTLNVAEVVSSALFTSKTVGSQSQVVSCPADRQLISCGYSFTAGNNFVTGPGVIPTVFSACIATYNQTSTSSVTGYVYAMCM